MYIHVLVDRLTLNFPSDALNFIQYKREMLTLDILIKRTVVV